MSLNNGQGWHSSFWLNAGNGLLLIADKGIRMEIDVFEVDSIQPTMTRHNIIEWRSSSTVATLTTGVYNARFDFRGWHVWGFLWKEDSVMVWIDGALAWTQAYAPIAWQHDHLNIWLTSIAYRDRPDDTKLPGTVKTDYIRYYQKDYVRPIFKYPHHKLPYSLYRIIVSDRWVTLRQRQPGQPVSIKRWLQQDRCLVRFNSGRTYQGLDFAL
jgi:hypothetical protein